MTTTLQPKVTLPQPMSQTSASDQPSELAGFSRILVALDHSEAAQMVFERAIALAQPHNSRLMLFSCIPDPVPTPAETTSGLIGVGLYGLDASAAVAVAEERLHKSVEEVQTWLQNYGELASQFGLQAEFDHKCGEPGPCICKLAEMWGADLIILGRRGRRGLTEALLGSVSNHVLHHAPCSVLVIQGHK